MRRGEQKELVAGKVAPLFLSETREFQNGNAHPRHAPIHTPDPFRHACYNIALILLLWVLLCLALCAVACGGAGSSSLGSPPPPAPSVTVLVSPSSANVLLGNSVGFTANVIGTSDTAVGWTVNGIPGGNSVMGSISATGNYQAPAILPAPATMRIVAASQADTAASATAAVTVSSDIGVQVSPATVNVEPGASQSFTATITSAGKPSTAVSWTLSGPGCTGAACGMITAAGLYTAPAAAPQPPQVTVTSTSMADTSKSASAAVTIVTTHVLAVSPSDATVALEQSQPLTAMLDGVATQSVTWSVNSIPGGNTTLGTISNSPSMNGLYLAPVDMPAAHMVTISAASTAYPALSASVTLQLTSDVAVSISPTTSTRIPGARQSFIASVAQSSNPQISWTVNGIPNGNATVGQICVSGSNPCSPPPAVTQPGTIDFLAPAAVPSPAQVTVAAVSAADPARFAAATVTITSQISVSISPPSATLPPQQVQLFTATVLGVADQNVSWDVNGSPNGSIPGGLICLPASSPCQAPNGPISGPVEFRAPAALPTPNTVSLRATSEATPPAQSVALVTITTAPYITGIVPASVFAGAQDSFGLRVSGVQFAASQPGPGSAILINGAPRAINCPSSTECDATLNPSDVASAGSVTISLQNAGGTSSNSVSLIVVTPQSTETVVSLDSSSPVASGMDITVVEPTLAGDDPPDPLSLLEIGLVDPATGSCTLSSPPLPVSRPLSGVTVVRMCVFGTSLDQVTQASFTAPSASDLSISNLNSSLGSLLLEFDVSLPAGAAPGPRTLFLATPNQDSAALTAAVEVQ